MIDNTVLTEAVYYILLSLREPLHGYGIMQHVAEMSGGRVNLAAGTLYGALGAMLQKELIVAMPGERNARKKEYRITEAGREAALREMERLRELLRNGETVYGGMRDEA